ncbi:MAG: hypothetical protein HC779_06560 [Phyllobacteriaceae bacterium]|nr:hypothetical protein [Phyllobacteriaceae bacterium]
MKLKLFPLALIPVVFLAGCQISGPINTLPQPVTPVQSGVSGNWVGTDGVAISTFGNGLFASFAADTGARLAEGTYRMVDANLVELTLTSLVRGTTQRVNCLLAGNDQLNCTSASGAQFSLVRTNRTPPPPVLAQPQLQGTVPRG